MGLSNWLDTYSGEIIVTSLVCTFGVCALAAAHFKIKGTWTWPVWIYALQVYLLKMKYYYRMRKMGTIDKDDKFSDMLKQRNMKFIETAAKNKFITRQDANSWYARLSRTWPELKSAIVYSEAPVETITPAPAEPLIVITGASHKPQAKGGASQEIKRKKRVIVP